MSEDLVHYAIPSCQTCLMLEHAYMQIALDCSQHTPTLRLCSNCGRLTRWLFYTWQSLLHTTALPISGLHMELGQPVDSVYSQIRAKSL